MSSDDEEDSYISDTVSFNSINKPNVFDWDKTEGLNSLLRTNPLANTLNNDQSSTDTDKNVEEFIKMSKMFSTMDTFGDDIDESLDLGSEETILKDTDKKIKMLLSGKINSQHTQSQTNIAIKSAPFRDDDSVTSLKLDHIRAKSIKAITPISTTVKRLLSTQSPRRSLNMCETSTTSVRSDLFSETKNMLFDDESEYENEIIMESELKISNVLEVISLIINNKPYYLENFRSLQQKIDLLNTALSTYNTTCILKIVMFLKNTLTTANFVELLCKYPKALNEYILFMYQNSHVNDDQSFLKLLDTQKVIIYHFKKALEILDIDHRIKYLKKHIEEPDNPISFKTIEDIREYIDLLSLQQKLIDTHKVVSESIQDSDNETINPCPIYVGSNLMDTAYFSIRQQIKNTKRIPETLQTEYKLNNKQFEWLIVKSITDLRYFDMLKTVFTPKVKGSGIFKSMAKQQSYVGFDVIARYLYRNSVPKEVLMDIISLIPEINMRLHLAEKFSLYDALIHICVSTRDRQMLIEKFESIDDVNFKNQVSKILEDKTIKWSN